jgi:hypothetical protein
MTPNNETLRIIASWVTRIADVCAQSDGKPSQEAIGTYAIVLGQTFPSAAFTAESLAHVVDGQKWFPPVAEISTLLARWWNVHRPRSSHAIVDGSQAGLDDMDRSWVRLWDKRNIEISELEDRRNQDFQRERLASLIRKESPRAAAALGLVARPEQRLSREAAAAIVARVRDSLAAPRVPTQGPPNKSPGPVALPRSLGCVSAWKKDPSGGVIGVQKGPLW